MTKFDIVSANQALHVDRLAQAEQFDMAARLAPLTAIIAAGATPAIVYVCWSPARAPYLLVYQALLAALAGLVLYAASRWRRCVAQDSLLHTAMQRGQALGVISSALMSCLLIFMLPVADSDLRALLQASFAGLMATGLTLAVSPKLFLSFLGPLTVGCLIAVLRLDGSYSGMYALLLCAYSGFLGFLSYRFGALMKARVADRVALDHERGLSTLLLKEFEESANDWTWETDCDLRLRRISDRAAEGVAKPLADWKGKSILALLDKAASTMDSPQLQLLRRTFERREPFRDILVDVRIGDETRWWQLSGKPTFLGKDFFYGYRGVGVDITEKKQAQDRLAFLALHDGLTDLANRAQFLQRLEEAKGVQSDVAVACLDIDEFKPVNNSFGHAAGDQLLQMAAKRMQNVLPEGALLARLSGDEFAILMRGAIAHDRAGIEKLGAEIVREIRRPFLLDGILVSVGVSLGVALGAECGCEDLMRRADLALHKAKKAGKNTLRFFDATMDVADEERRMLSDDLRCALARKELVLYFQPLVNAATNLPQGFEALLRWRHPKRGLVPPDQFIPLAEETGAIVAIGEWVIRQACQTAAQWQEGLRVSVNLSPVQIKFPNLPDIVADALAESGLQAHRLELELTETALVESGPSTLLVLEQLRSMGVRLSLDDFGTGYSSLSYLRKFLFDSIKIDRCFVQELPHNERDLSIVRAVVDIATTLGASITAEGVETVEQSRCLLAQGCHQLQGFLFSRATPAEDIGQLLQTLESRRAA